MGSVGAPVDVGDEVRPRRTGWTRAGGLAVAVLLLALAVVAGLAVGARSVPPAVVFDALTSGGGGPDGVVVRDLRVPRTLLGVAVGVALGAAGALMQALTRNPLADPGVLGINWGASAAIVLGIVAFGATSLSGYVWFSFAGAALVSVVVYLLGTVGRSSATPARLALAGAAIGASLQALVYALLLLDPTTFDRFRVWRLGTLSGRDPSVLLQVLPFLVVGLVLAAALARALNALALGEETGRALGVQVGRTRAVTGVAIVLLCGGATAAAGPIAFVGLAVPHAARAVAGPDQRWVLPYSMVLAAVLMVVSDVVGRLVVAPGELEVGIVVAFVGAPVFLAIARRRRMAAL